MRARRRAVPLSVRRSAPSGLDVVDVTDPAPPGDPAAGACAARRCAPQSSSSRTYRLCRQRTRGARDRRRRAPGAAADLHELHRRRRGSTTRATWSSARPTPRCSPMSPTGVNGLKVIQLTSPETQPNFYGFSPEPKPELIAWYPTASPALALSRGLERDRGVDETGQPDRGLRPHRLAAVQSGRDEAALYGPRRPALCRDRPGQDRRLCAGPAVALYVLYAACVERKRTHVLHCKVMGLPARKSMRSNCGLSRASLGGGVGF